LAIRLVELADRPAKRKDARCRIAQAD